MSVARRSLQVFAFICTLIVGVTAMAVIVTQTRWFKEWLRGFIVRQAEDYVNGRLSIGRLDGNLFFGVELEDVDVTMNGKTVVEIKDVGLDYNGFSFLVGHAVLDDIRINQPVFRIERTAEGWNITQLIKARTPDPDEPKTRPDLEVGEIGISDGTLYLEDKPAVPVGTAGTAQPGVRFPSRIEKLDASVGVTSNKDELKVAINHVSLRVPESQFDLNDLSGVIRRYENTVALDNVSLRTAETSLRVAGTISNIEGGPPTLELKASSDKTTLSEIARIVPALRGYQMQPAYEISASGPLDKLAVDFNVRETNLGNVIGDLIVDANGSDKHVAGTVSMNHFNAAPIARNAAMKTDVTGRAQIDLDIPSSRQPLSGTYIVQASRANVAGYEARDVNARGRIDDRVITVDGSAAAYGGRATAKGTINTAAPMALDLSGRAINVDLRNLPPVFKAPGVPSDLQFTYTVTGRNGVYSVETTLDASTISGASIAQGTTAQFTVGAGRPPEYAAKGQVASLDVQQIGRGFGIQALAADRYRSRINATFDVKGSGGGRFPLTLDATGSAVDSDMFGASFPRLDFTTNIGGGDARIRAIGQFANLNPEAVTGNPKTKGILTGDVNVDTTLRQYASGVTVDSFDATGQVNLTNSEIGDLKIDKAAVDGTYANREGHLNQLTINGPDLTITGQGDIALNETGASNLTAHIESPSLDRLGAIIGQPLKGATTIDTTVTGNGAELKASGTLQGSNIGYGENEALTLKSTFNLSMPDLMPAASTIQAKSDATFVEIGGQRITGLTAETTYVDKKLEFNALAKEGMRELEAQGTAFFQPEQREVHLGTVALRTEQIEWRTAPNQEATIRYGGDRIGIENLHLVSGDQRIAAEGVLGSPTETLRVRAENVDVAQLDRLFLGDQRLAGRLNADARVSGPIKDPRAEGQFTLAPGAFRQFKFESLAGSLDYIGRGMNVDVRLQQSPTAWLTAKGYAPLSLFRPNPPGMEGHETPAPGEAIDLQVASSEIDLGIVQGFTSYVTNVTGALQANVRVEGSGYDPHVTGAVDIRGGGFAVPDLGTRYTGLDTRIDLKPDAVTINEMRILDDDKHVLTVGGTLAVHERSVGAVDVKIQSDRFTVVRNDYARMNLSTDLRLTGEVRAPRVVGSVEVGNGTIDAARVLERATSNPYATTATPIEELQPGPAAGSPFKGIYDALDLEVGVGIPSNLVLNGRDLRTANAPIDIGDISVTVGGAVQVRKTPGGKVRLLGEVNTVRGNYQFQGRRFEILRDGRIRFAGTDDIDPLVDLRARRVISGVETFVRVQGSLTMPELTFSSNPPQDQADILSLIIFGAPTNELTEGQQISLGEQAAALAGGYLASGLSRSIADALRLDEFELQAQGEQGLGPTVSIGEQIGARTYVRIRQGFGAEQATEFILEYQIADYLRLQGSVAETAGGTQRITFRRIERGGIDLIFFFSY